MSTEKAQIFLLSLAKKLVLRAQLPATVKVNLVLLGLAVIV